MITTQVLQSFDPPNISSLHILSQPLYLVPFPQINPSDVHLACPSKCINLQYACRVKQHLGPPRPALFETHPYLPLNRHLWLCKILYLYHSSAKR